MRDSVRGWWLLYLRLLSASLLLASLALVALPDLGSSAFSLLIYQQQSLPADFSVEARSYIRLANAVLGAVMAGWFAMIYCWSGAIVRERRAWVGLTLSLAVWFVPDTGYSLVSGYWENALLNTCILCLFAPPLLATRHAVKGSAAPAEEVGRG